MGEAEECSALAAGLVCHSRTAGFEVATDSVEVEEGAPVPACPILAASRWGCQRLCQEVVRRDGARAAVEETTTAPVGTGHTGVEEAEEGERNCCSAMGVVEVVYTAGAGCP